MHAQDSTRFSVEPYGPNEPRLLRFTNTGFPIFETHGEKVNDEQLDTDLVQGVEIGVELKQMAETLCMATDFETQWTAKFLGSLRDKKSTIPGMCEKYLVYKNGSLVICPNSLNNSTENKTHTLDTAEALDDPDAVLQNNNLCNTFVEKLQKAAEHAENAVKKLTSITATGDLLLGTIKALETLGQEKTQFLQLSECRSDITESTRLENMLVAYAIRQRSLAFIMESIKNTKENIRDHGCKAHSKFLNIISQLVDHWNIHRLTNAEIYGPRTPGLQQLFSSYGYLPNGEYRYRLGVYVNYISLPIFGFFLRNMAYIKDMGSQLKSAFILWQPTLNLVKESVSNGKNIQSSDQDNDDDDDDDDVKIVYDSIEGKFTKERYHIKLEVSVVKRQDESEIQEKNKTNSNNGILPIYPPTSSVPISMDNKIARQIHFSLRRAQWIALDRTLFYVLCEQASEFLGKDSMLSFGREFTPKCFSTDENCEGPGHRVAAYCKSAIASGKMRPPRLRLVSFSKNSLVFFLSKVPLVPMKVSMEEEPLKFVNLKMKLTYGPSSMHHEAISNSPKLIQLLENISLCKLRSLFINAWEYETCTAPALNADRVVGTAFSDWETNNQVSLDNEETEKSVEDILDDFSNCFLGSKTARDETIEKDFKPAVAEDLVFYSQEVSPQDLYGAPLQQENKSQIFSLQNPPEAARPGQRILQEFFDYFIPLCSLTFSDSTVQSFRF